MDQSVVKFSVFFHKGTDRHETTSVWALVRDEATTEKEATILTFQLTAQQRKRGYRYSVRPITRSGGGDQTWSTFEIVRDFPDRA